MKSLLSLLLSIYSVTGLSQFTNSNTLVSSSGTTVVTNTSVVNTGTLSLQGELVLNGGGTFTTNSAIRIPGLTLQTGSYATSGQITVTDNLTLQSGTFLPDADAQFIVGPNAVITRQEGYVAGTLYHQGAGDKFFPIGTADTYTPVSLTEVQNATEALVGIRAVNQDIGINTAVLPVSINNVSSDWYWEILAENTFNGARIALPVLPEDSELLSSGNVEGVVVEVSDDLSQANSLGRGSGSDGTQVVSRDITTGPIVTLGARNIVQVVIRNLITPNGDNENDYLFIENLELIEGTKKVYFLDRWGANTGNNIMDFVNDDPGLTAFFERFESGNYICVLQLEDGRKIKQPVTILKE
ncbi:hypothetical protein FNH22_03735 [Fulvivirga sp. M361]|uniref:T9SS type B sorting domain-containing protein n=1 Tax=Fulvivirga sp. M361 TaxID=2594266 RepID=UPI00117A8A12|nr:gliding motility-associated C-terminal domain-containing protein [Fulvivirga sp. M361]TRX61176.1 hypothetical protein FNH22_03735 [Fulvivirga sp. M361]